LGPGSKTNEKSRLVTNGVVVVPVIIISLESVCKVNGKIIDNLLSHEYLLHTRSIAASAWHSLPTGC